MVDQQMIVTLLASSGIVGTLLVPLISFLKGLFKLDEEPSTPTKTRIKTVLSLVTSIGGGVLVVNLMGEPVVGNLEGLLIAGAVVFTSATIIYKTFWQDSKPEAKVESVGKSLR